MCNIGCTEWQFRPCGEGDRGAVLASGGGGVVKSIKSMPNLDPRSSRCDSLSTLLRMTCPHSRACRFGKMVKTFLSSLLLALTVLIAVSPVYADGESISSVTVVGATEQNGTPTPTNPVNIKTNNGVLKSANFNQVVYGGHNNRFGVNCAFDNGVFSVTGTITSTYSNCITAYDNSMIIGNVYYLKRSIVENPNNVNFRIGMLNQSAPNNWSSGFFTATSTGVSAGIYGATTNTNFDGVKFRFQVFDLTKMFGAGKEPATVEEADNMIAKVYGAQMDYYPATIGTPKIYVDGTVETIADSANHTATVATLLGVGDYRDTQNINTGAITRKVGVKVLDGTEGWDKNATANYYRITPSSIGAMANVPMLCSHFIHGSLSKVENFNNGGTFINFYPNTSVATTTAGWKTWLADQYAAGTPVIIVYPLATETTESVAGQTMTTAPVNNRTGGVTGMTITTLLSSGASVVTTIAANAIKIATTAYNAARFNPVQTELNNTIATIRSVVTNTINQTAAIASLQADKQTRPEDACPAGKKCLLVETEENGVIVPHWFPIIEAPEE